MRPLTKRLRDAVKHIDGAWVRVWKDAIWVGRRGIASNKWHAWKQVGEVRDALEAAGFECSYNGKSGTAGEFIIDVKVPPR